ncbi:MAG: hypothetical protein AAF804_02030 [Bacteroidota bacterium]
MKYLVTWGLLSLIVLSACNRINLKPDGDGSRLQKVEFETLDLRAHFGDSCFVYSQLDPEEAWVVRSVAEYSSLDSALQDRWTTFNTDPDPACLGYSLPEIDFTEYTLLIAGAGGSGCNPGELEHVIYQCEAAEEYTVVTTMQETGLCQAYWIETGWILVKNLDPDYTVKFSQGLEEE